jgi:hypothetical protein
MSEKVELSKQALVRLAQIINENFPGHIANANISVYEGTLTLTIANHVVRINQDLEVESKQQHALRTCGPGVSARINTGPCAIPKTQGNK